MKGQHLLECLADLGAGGELRAEALAQAFALELQAELEIPELLKDKAPVGRGAGGLEFAHRGAGLGKMQRAQGGHAPGKLEPRAEGWGQGLFGLRAGLGQLFKDAPQDAAGPLRGELCAPGRCAAEALVDGNDAAHLEHGELGVRAGGVGLRQNLELRLHELEAACAAGARALELAIDRDPLTEAELVA